MRTENTAVTSVSWPFSRSGPVPLIRAWQLYLGAFGHPVKVVSVFLIQQHYYLMGYQKYMYTIRLYQTITFYTTIPLMVQSPATRRNGHMRLMRHGKTRGHVLRHHRAKGHAHDANGEPPRMLYAACWVRWFLSQIWMSRNILGDCRFFLIVKEKKPVNQIRCEPRNIQCTRQRFPNNHAGWIKKHVGSLQRKPDLNTNQRRFKQETQWAWENQKNRWVFGTKDGLLKRRAEKTLMH